MQRAQAGDVQAYRELLEAVRVILQIYSARSLKRMGIQDQGSVDDLVQEILLAIHNKRHTYDPTLMFTPWLFAIARYKLIDFARASRRRGHTVSIDEVEEELSAPVFADPTAEGDLSGLLAALPEKSRRILELIKLEGLSVAETSARMQMRESAVKVTVHRALKNLRAKLHGKAGS